MPIAHEDRRLFEKLGFERVRIELLSCGEDAVKGGQAREHARQWISEQERNQRRLFTAIAALTLIAAAIAAWPVVMGWLAAMCPK
jgi:hypothetical protein